MTMYKFPGNEFPSDLIIETRKPAFIPEGEDSLEFHASRILLLLRYVGGRKFKIEGRTKLAKLDFFLRYPTYLHKALGISDTENYFPNPESPMIRYKYGPWDAKYYNVFALLTAKGLIEITPTTKGDIFQLTETGKFAVSELINPDYQELIDRCKLIYDHFKRFSGSKLKNLIYENFPEIVNKPLGEEIK